MLYSTSLPTIADNTKRINKLTKLVEKKIYNILKQAFFYKNQPLNAPALTVVSSLSCLTFKKILFSYCIYDD